MNVRKEAVRDIHASLQEWARLLEIDNKNASRAERLYFEHILGWVIEMARMNPRNSALANQRCDLLISLMGYSPETTVIASALLRPKALAVLLNDNVNGSFRCAFDYLVNRLGEPGADNIRLHRINPTNYLEIREVMRIEQRGMRAGEHAFVDITGGKKVMSAIAGQAAWELDLPLCYVESPAYNPALRRPDPGSEQLLLFPKPSEQKKHENADEPFELSCYHNQKYLV